MVLNTTIDALDTQATKQDTAIIIKAGTDDELDIRSATKKRGGKRSSATKTIKSVNIGGHDKGTMEAYKDRLETIQSELQDLDEEINTHMMTYHWSYAQYVQEAAVCESYQENIAIAIRQLNNILSMQTQNLSQSQGSQNNNTALPSKHASIKDIDLPSFDGNIEEYPRFIKSFENLVNNYSLSSIEKYGLLLKKLSGSAKAIAKSVEVDNMDYNAAKALLDAAFCDSNVQKEAIIKNFLKLNMGTDRDDVVNFIGEARVLNQQAMSLNITSEDFRRYFLWRGMTEEFRSSIMTETSKSFPSLNEILSSAFDANRRIHELKASEKKQPTKETSSMTLATSTQGNSGPPSSKAPKQNTKAKGCSLCTHDKSSTASNHKLVDCSVYKEPKSKFDKLKSIGGCTNCGSISHRYFKCKVSFPSRCSKCNRWHQVWLCQSESKKPNAPSVPEKSPDGTSLDTNSNSVTYTCGNNSSNDVILPTATVGIGTKNKQKYRLLKDPCSQTTFVLSSVANKHKCKTIQDGLKLQLQGINSATSHITKTVEIDLNIPGVGTRKIQAVCIDEIPTSMKIPQLRKIQKVFTSKGYKLADSNLNSELINNVSIVLGSDNPDIYPLTQVSFGKNSSQSSYFDTPAGVMLFGKASTLVDNLSALKKIE